MEIVLAVVLLFGGFILGSVTADTDDDAVMTIQTQANEDGIPGSSPVTPALRQVDPTRCHSDRGIMYRDLTEPYPGQTDQPASQAGDCDGECPDE